MQNKMAKRKPRGYWKKEENVVAEAKKLMEEHNFETLPTQKKLWKLGYSSLIAAILKYHGGLHQFRELLGGENKTRKSDTWKSLEYTIQQAKEIMEKYDLETFPGGDTLKKLGYSSLSCAISNYHGGFHEFRKTLGEQPKKLKDGTWDSLKYTIEQAKDLMEKHDFETLPTPNKLRELGYSSLSNSITRYHGGFHKFRKLLGQDQIVRKKGIWKSIDYTIQQAQEVMELHGLEIFPNANELCNIGYSSLSNSITKHHGGFRKFRKLLGEELTRRESGIWKSLDYTIQQAQEIMEKHDYKTLPSQKKLGELGHSSLSSAISQYHGGFQVFRAVLAGKQLPTEKEKLTDLVRKYAE